MLCERVFQWSPKIKHWKEKICLMHKVHYETAPCDCKPPIRMYTFPKDQNTKSQWVKNINRQDSNASVTFKSWQPNVDSRICSDHFEDEFPTEKNPYPHIKNGP